MQQRGGQQAVLVTRPAEAIGPTLARLQEMGFATISAPLLDIQPVLTDLPPPSSLQAVLVTSARALSALPASYHHLRLLAVGDATAANARARGHNHVLSADGDATHLLRLALAHCTTRSAPATQDVAFGETVLLLSGVGEGAALAANLAEHFQVAHRFVYQAQPVAELPETARAALQATRLPLTTMGTRLAAALFFSAATAETFVTLAEAAGLRDTVIHVEALAISAATARVLARLPWRAVRVAPRPNQDELLALLR